MLHQELVVIDGMTHAVLQKQIPWQVLRQRQGHVNRSERRLNVAGTSGHRIHETLVE